jgi:hypothetical protein
MNQRSENGVHLHQCELIANTKPGATPKRQKSIRMFVFAPVARKTFGIELLRIRPGSRIMMQNVRAQENALTLLNPMVAQLIRPE